MSGTITFIFGGDPDTRCIAARQAHLRGPGAATPFVLTDVNALPESLLESELFGTRGFPGKVCASSREARARAELGHVGLADCGSLYVDHFDAVRAHVQDELVQLAETGEVVFDHRVDFITLPWFRPIKIGQMATVRAAIHLIVGSDVDPASDPSPLTARTREAAERWPHVHVAPPAEHRSGNVIVAGWTPLANVGHGSRALAAQRADQRTDSIKAGRSTRTRAIDEQGGTS